MAEAITIKVGYGQKNPTWLKQYFYKISKEKDWCWPNNISEIKIMIKHLHYLIREDAAGELSQYILKFGKGDLLKNGQLFSFTTDKKGRSENTVGGFERTSCPGGGGW